MTFPLLGFLRFGGALCLLCMKLCQHRGFPHIVRSALCNAACIVHRLARLIRYYCPFLGLPSLIDVCPLLFPVSYSVSPPLIAPNCVGHSPSQIFYFVKTANKPTADHSMAIHRRLDSFSLIFYLLLILWVKTELRQSLPPITSGFQLLRSLSANKYFC